MKSKVSGKDKSPNQVQDKESSKKKTTINIKMVENIDENSEELNKDTLFNDEDGDKKKKISKLLKGLDLTSSIL
jgi:hypothetical protein